MTRKDGRPLVWDHPVTAEDEIEYLTREEERAVRGTLCAPIRDTGEAWMFDA